MSLSSVIRYEGGDGVLVWKHPKKFFNTETTLIVHETQEVLLFRNGTAEKVYGPGRHFIEMENAPVIETFISLVRGGSINECELYFVNKAFQLDVPWGTSKPIVVQDTTLGLMINIAAFGQMVLSVEDTWKFVLKLVGTKEVLGKSYLVDLFRGQLMNRIKDNLSKLMVQHQISILEVNTYLADLSELLTSVIRPTFEEFGIGVNSFYIESINPIENEAYMALMTAHTNRAVRKVEGYTYHEERSFDVAEAQAKNSGVSGTTAGVGVGAAVGLGMGQMMGRIVSGSMEPAVTGINNSPKQNMSDFGTLKLGERLQLKRLCPECGNMVYINMSKCPQCHKDLTEIVRRCPGCNTIVTSDNKFCPDCGTKL